MIEPSAACTKEWAYHNKINKILRGWWEGETKVIANTTHQSQIKIFVPALTNCQVKKINLFKDQETLDDLSTFCGLLRINFLPKLSFFVCTAELSN
jgi:hypothetical protein